MTTALVYAAVAVAVAAATANLVPRALSPAFAARLVTAIAVTTAISFLWLLLVVAGTQIGHLHRVAERVTWCASFVSEHIDDFSPAALGSVGLLVAFGFSAIRVRRRQRELTARPGAAPLQVVESSDVTAFALPGRFGHPGQVVVSTGLLEALDPIERRIVLAHEQAHLDHRHHRYLRATQIAGALFPVVRPLLGRVRFATERWADEVAARSIGDRALVARTIARVALLKTSVGGHVLEFAGDDVVARVGAMLEEDPRQTASTRGVVAAMVSVCLVALSLVSVMLHHWAVWFFGYC